VPSGPLYMNASFAKALAVLSALFALSLLLFGGIWLGGHPERLPGFIRNAFVDDERALRAEIVDSIKDNFYKPVADSQIREGSLKGIVDGLGDQFSAYITPAQAKAFEEAVEGKFDGVGVSVAEDRRGLKVTRVFEGSPAEKAGIEQGEFVTGVNGSSIAGLSSKVATAKIKGKAGTRVRLQVVDPKRARVRTLELTRAKIDVPVAEGRLRSRDGRSLGVVSLTAFSSGAHGKLRQEMDELLRRGAEGIVLDLRGNPGGLIDEAVLVSSQFVEDGLITFTKGRTKPRREFEASEDVDAIAGGIPVVVLVDGGSASAAEIVTGALRDTKRATVVGTRTFGKGVFQDVERLSNGGVLEITAGEYFLPKGENIGKKGVVPEIRARDDPATDRDEALPVALRTLAEKAAAR